jgi:hypothetical protein
MREPREHRDIERVLDEYVDGALDDLRARAVRGHLRECAACSARVEATQRLIAAAAELPPCDPPAELWSKVAAGLDAEESALAHRGRLWWLWQAVARKAAWGGAALAAAAAALWLVALRAREPAPAPVAQRVTPSPAALYEEALRDVAHAEDDYRVAVTELRRLAVDERPRWKPEVRRAFDENLAAIDAALERQSELARVHPGDVAVADALAESYRKQIDFLQEAVVRGEGR